MRRYEEVPPIREASGKAISDHSSETFATWQCENDFSSESKVSRCSNRNTDHSAPATSSDAIGFTAARLADTISGEQDIG